MTFNNNLKTWTCQEITVAQLYRILALIAYKITYKCNGNKSSELCYEFVLLKELDHSCFK